MITNPTPNQTRAIEILNCIAFLKTQTTGLAALITDNDPMPDGVGTVASAISFAAIELEKPYLELDSARRAIVVKTEPIAAPPVQDAPGKTPPLPGADAAKAAPAGSQTAKTPEIVATTAPRKPNMVNGREIH